MSKIWFTADHHFGHRKIISLCKRPFQNGDEMTDAMIARWNAVVGKDDVVWHLGDFAYGASEDETKAIFSCLNGVKHLVIGNHDTPIVLDLAWASFWQMAEIEIDGQRLVLSHYPFLEWPGYWHKRSPSWHLFGHVHGNTLGVGRSLDVGVDCWNFAPVSLSQIRQRLRERGAIE